MQDARARRRSKKNRNGKELPLAPPYFAFRISHFASLLRRTTKSAARGPPCPQCPQYGVRSALDGRTTPSYYSAVLIAVAVPPTQNALRSKRHDPCQRSSRAPPHTVFSLALFMFNLHNPACRCSLLPNSQTSSDLTDLTELTTCPEPHPAPALTCTRWH